MNQLVKRRVRCAIYTRKSHEESEEVEYNSLHAQRDAGEAYIASQKHEGWLMLPDYYDDNGFTGGNLDRPALQRLLADIKAGKLDIVVVYKIDRLTRSLFDFAQLIEVFTAHNVSFVSVTQSFNTSTSMGRLVLNILLSFAQFERELTGERIRDKIASSKKRGMWMGGVPPLGYDVIDQKLIINQKEAEQIRHIYKRFIELRSTTVLAKEMRAEGYRTKSYTNQKGEQRHGVLMSKAQIYRILRNRIYLGEITHKDQVWPGQHKPIIDQAVWNAANEVMQVSPRVRGRATVAKTPAMLRGLLRCCSCESVMSPVHTRKGTGRQYRYYKPSRSLKGNCETCPIQAIPAGEIENLVVDHMQQVLASPAMIVKTWAAAHQQDEMVTEDEVRKALTDIHTLWPELFPVEQSRILNLLIERIIVSADNVNIVMRPNGIEALARDIGRKKKTADKVG